MAKSGNNWQRGPRVKEIHWRGKVRYRAEFTRDGRRVRQLCKSKGEAEIVVASLKLQVQEAGQVWAEFSPKERNSLMAVAVKAKAHGIDLQELVAERLRNPQSNSVSVSLGEAVAQLVKGKRDAGKSSDYVDSLEGVLNDFARGREATRLEAVSLAMVEGYLAAKQRASWSTYRARLSTLFKFGIRRRWCVSNPCVGLEAVEYVKPPPRIFNPDDLAKALAWLRQHPKGAPWFVLSTFCGLRPEEAQKTSADKIHLDSGVIVVDAQSSKRRLRRIVHPLLEVMALLKSVLQWRVRQPAPIMRIARMKSKKRWLWEAAKLPLSRGERRTVQRLLRAHLGWKVWPKDITRHTAASLWLAIKPDAAFIAMQLANSEEVLKRDYIVPIAPAEVKRFKAVLKG